MSSNSVKFTEKQQIAFDAILSGKNIFLTGAGGTGKSLIIKTFKKVCGPTKRIAITSTTGISALLIGGTTLHSYLGIGLGTGSIETLEANILKKSWLKKRWNDVEVLVIDEISMLSPELFDKIQLLARKIRKKHADKPFGGIQLVLTGDFLQLPVVKNTDFCFEAESWESCIDEIVYLTEIVRQTDPDFQDCLNNLRFGIITDSVRKLLESRVDVVLENDIGIKPTKIFTTNADVDKINGLELNKLNGEDVEYYQYDMSFYFYGFHKDVEYLTEKYGKDCSVNPRIQLCKGCQVMLAYNIDLPAGLANGSRGVVIDFVEDLPLVKFMNGQERIIDYNIWEVACGDTPLLRITQIPLKLAWATTVHKSQGSTLDYAEIDLSNVFEYGQTYVALSRVKSKEGLKISNLVFETIKASPKAKKFYKSLC